MIVAAPFVNRSFCALAMDEADIYAPTRQAPVVVDTPFVHDPVMAYEDGVYYLYCTGHGITQMTSTDRQHWTLSREGVLPNGKIPAWTHDSVPGFETHIWAPDVVKYRGKWYMGYSCSTFGKNTSAIGLLSNKCLSDKDGWKDEGCIVASRGNRDNWNAIDPNFIIDEKGKPWMTWGSFWDGIQLIPLDKTMHPKKGAKPQTIARRHAVGDASAEPNPTSKFAGTNAIEAPFIMQHGGYYYLFVSWDYCCRGIKSNYRVAVGRSKKVAGPYLDRDGKPMLEGGGTLLLEGDKKEYEALGHCSAYHFPDGDVFFCHGYSVAKNGASILVQKRIEWTEDGWLTLE
ncbi:MAG: arabinan endo-1,5-alpha-L-arabinosidase [Prevotella sp.]|nr:arabinan endo-1,5-alpha-L-arabinosidase [Prevotella sp.]